MIISLMHLVSITILMKSTWPRVLRELKFALNGRKPVYRDLQRQGQWDYKQKRPEGLLVLFKTSLGAILNVSLTFSLKISFFLIIKLNDKVEFTLYCWIKCAVHFSLICHS